VLQAPRPHPADDTAPSTMRAARPQASLGYPTAAASTAAAWSFRARRSHNRPPPRPPYSTTVLSLRLPHSGLDVRKNDDGRDLFNEIRPQYRWVENSFALRWGRVELGRCEGGPRRPDDGGCSARVGRWRSSETKARDTCPCPVRRPSSHFRSDFA
jgi:hypothetical protein